MDRSLDNVALQACDMSKAFAGVQALKDVSLDLRAGEVHALMGENGAGKSTLVRIVAGLCAADTGKLRVGGQDVLIKTPYDAMRHGIAMIHQELMPVPHMTVAENLLLGREPRGWFPGTVDRVALRAEARRLLRVLDVDIPVDRRMGALSVAEMQAVEIARALGCDALVVIMDEPTAAISQHETDALFAAISRLKERGVSIVFITHKMEEVFRIADRVTVLRDGERVETAPVSELDERRLIGLMVGREMEGPRKRQRPQTGETLLSVRGLTRNAAFRNVSLDVRRGEVLGLAGLMGAGRTEVVSAIFGLVPADSGTISVKGCSVRIRRPADAMRHGIGMVTEDRKGYGIVPEMAVAHNVTLAALRDACVGPVIADNFERRLADKAIDTFRIRTAGRRQVVSQLSGGNQQKAVIARTLLCRPEVVILDEPTRGIDIAAKAEVYGIIEGLSRRGCAVVLVSSELPEILKLADRVMVLRQGEVVVELAASETTQEEILAHAMPV
jgi:inositol transport system ATP-binding protein